MTVAQLVKLRELRKQYINEKFPIDDDELELEYKQLDELYQRVIQDCDSILSAASTPVAAQLPSKRHNEPEPIPQPVPS